MKIKGFTLAEVLITLAIIGVIAAISVPSLIQKTNQAELITAWKKDFASFSQAMQNYAFQEGNIALKTNPNDYVNAFGNYLKIIKKCNSTAIDGVCWHGANTWTKITGVTITTSSNGSGGAILNSGSLMTVGYNAAWVCKQGELSANDYTDPNCCAHVHFDINGFKKPNAIGKDIFGVMLFSDGTALPFTNNNTCETDPEGWVCSRDYLYKK